ALTLTWTLPRKRAARMPRARCPPLAAPPTSRVATRTLPRERHDSLTCGFCRWRRLASEHEFDERHGAPVGFAVAGAGPRDHQRGGAAGRGDRGLAAAGRGVRRARRLARGGHPFLRALAGLAVRT